MANNLDAFTPEYWSARTQRLLKKQLISREISNMEESSTLRDGDTVHRPSYSDVTIHNYVKGQDVTVQDVVATDEYLVVNTSKEATVYIDDIDVKQNKYDAANLYIDRITYALKKDIDGAFLREAKNAAYVMNDNNAPYAITAGNVFSIFTDVEAMMNAHDVEDTKAWFAVITPEVKAKLQQSSLTNGFSMADASLKGILKGMGYLGTRGNFNIFVSNNLSHSMKLSGSVSGTVTINGVTLTANATGTAAGQFKNTFADLAAAINETAGTYNVSAEDRKALVACGAFAEVVSDGVIIYTAGKAGIDASAMTKGTLTANCWFGQYGCTDLVIQKDVTIQKNKAPLKTGWNYLAYTLYGIKTFEEGAKRCVKLEVEA